MSLGFDFYRNIPDSDFIEKQILPTYKRRPDIRVAVHTGVDWYTRGYPRIWHPKTLYSIEVHPHLAQAHGGHGAIADSCANVADYFVPGSVDVAFFLGVYGYGLNDLGGLNQHSRAFTPSSGKEERWCSAGTTRRKEILPTSERIHCSTSCMSRSAFHP